ncbi:MAG: hypothetical protein PVH21_12610 [Myxococcales bacterium]
MSNDPKADPSRLQSKRSNASMTETAMRELGELARDVQHLSDGIRDRIGTASRQLQPAWIEIEREVERFRRAVEDASLESVSELRETGFALKRRLRRLRSEVEDES